MSGSSTKFSAIFDLINNFMLLPIKNFKIFGKFRQISPSLVPSSQASQSATLPRVSACSPISLVWLIWLLALPLAYPRSYDDYSGSLVANLRVPASFM